MSRHRKRPAPRHQAPRHQERHGPRPWPPWAADGPAHGHPRAAPASRHGHAPCRGDAYLRGRARRRHRGRDGLPDDQDRLQLRRDAPGGRGVRACRDGCVGARRQRIAGDGQTRAQRLESPPPAATTRTRRPHPLAAGGGHRSRPGRRRSCSTRRCASGRAGSSGRSPSPTRPARRQPSWQLRLGYDSAHIIGVWGGKWTASDDHAVVVTPDSGDGTSHNGGSSVQVVRRGLRARRAALGMHLQRPGLPDEPGRRPLSAGGPAVAGAAGNKAASSRGELFGPVEARSAGASRDVSGRPGWRQRVTFPP